LAGGSFDGTGTPLVIAPDKRWTPNTAGLRLLSGLLPTLLRGGVLTGRSLPAIADMARTQASLNYPESAQRAELSPNYLGDVKQTAGWIHGVASSLSRARGDDAPLPADILGPLSLAMAPLGSAALRTNDRVGRSILHTAQATLTGLQSGVVIVEAPSYTLLAAASPLLITVRNDLPYVAKVRLVVIGGESVGLTAKEPGTQSIPAGRSQQFKIDTNVVKAGKFPLSIQLRAADGSAWSPPTTITVNSSAYGTLTIVLIAVAGGALLLMVAIRIVQRVRHRNQPGDPAADSDRNQVGAGADPGNPAGRDASFHEATGAPPGDGTRLEDRPPSRIPAVSQDESGERPL
jgi:hypothetical protein